MIICDFCNTTPIIINGSIRKVDKVKDDYNTIQDLYVSLKDIYTKLSKNKEIIKMLNESNDVLKLRNIKLNKIINHLNNN